MKGVCIDISGVIHTGKRLSSPNAVKSFQKLKDAGLKCLFVTNTSREPNSKLYSNLASFGFANEDIKIFSSPEACKSISIQGGFKKPYLLMHENLVPDFSEFSQTSTDEKDYDCVILGNLSNNTTYSQMNFAFRILRSIQSSGKVPTIISMGRNKYFEDHDLKLSMGTSGILCSFENALTNWTPSLTVIIAGKPGRIMFDGACKVLDMTASECFMIGDDFDGDIVGSCETGMTGILVQTGKYTFEDKERISELQKTGKKCHLVDDFDHAVDLILRIKDGQ